MKGCRGCLFGVLCVLSVLAFAFAVLFARRQTRIREREKERAETEALIRAHTDNAPPPDFHGWLAEFGANEPDPSTPEGQASLEAEGARLPLAKERLQRLLERFHSMLTSENGAVEDAYLSDFLQTLEGFSRASCAELLWSVRWGKCGGKILRNKVVMAGPERGAVVVERYYRVICRMVDLLWTRGGLEYKAAEADLWTYSSLRHCKYLARRKNWSRVEAAVDQCLEHWKEFRCDSENSNFCRAHRYWEERYNLYYKERVRRGETDWLQPLSAYYRYHLDQARGILKREPKWSPGPGHGLYDDAPGGVKPQW